MKASNTVKGYAALLVVCLMAGGTPVMAQEVKPKAGGGGASAAEAGKKLSDPLSDIWALFTEFNHTWSDGGCLSLRVPTFSPWRY